MKTIENVNFFNKRVFVRVDFNVPLDQNQKILDDTRILRALSTIKKISFDGGKVIIASHMGRPKNGYNNKFSLVHIVKKLSSLLGQPVAFSADCFGDVPEGMIKKMNRGDVLVLENLRFHKQETSGCSEFAKKLSHLADAYVNDAFGVSHRKHASTFTIASFFKNKSYFGLLMKKEIESLNLVFKKPIRPVTAIVGGAKISSKIFVLKSLIGKVDNIIVGGGMAYTFFKAQGFSVGRSLVENNMLGVANEILNLVKKSKTQFFLPIDSLNSTDLCEFENTETTTADKIGVNKMGVDIGSGSVGIFSETIINSKTVVWNGPMGVFEKPAFERGTKSIALAVVEATKRGAFTLVGGGDSVAAIKKFNLMDGVSYVSTGGGAMLEFLEGKKLPGILAVGG